jgi:hypothetical protein
VVLFAYAKKEWGERMSHAKPPLKGSASDFLIVERIIVVVAAMYAIVGASGYTRNDAVNSRLATVYSLANYGTWRIDRPLDQEPIRFERETIDKVMVDGRLISSKPPVLPLVMTAEYLFLNKVLGWSLDNERDTDWIVRTMSMSLIGGSYIMALLLYVMILQLFVPDAFTRLILVFCLAFCTQLWGYSTHINNHVPAAGMVLAAVYIALGVGTGKVAPGRWRFLLFGFFGGLVPTIDMPGTIFVFLGGLYLLAKHPGRTLTWVSIGAALPLGVHCIAMLAATGSVLPVQMRPEAYLYEASYWRSPQGIDALNEPKGIYLFNMLFGRCGIFSLYPILFIGMAATLRAFVLSDTRYRGHIIMGAVGFIILTIYYVFKTDNYGGEAYGFRWSIVAMPILLLMGSRTLLTLRARWKWMFISVLIGVSFYSGFECAKSPWGANNSWVSKLFLGPSYGRILPKDE